MGFFDSIGDFCSSAVDVVSSVASGTADVVGSVASGAVDVVSSVASGTADVVGNVASGAVDVVSSVASGTADVVGNVASGAVDVVSSVVDVVVENPSKTALLVAGTIATGGALAGVSSIAARTGSLVGAATSSTVAGLIIAQSIKNRESQRAIEELLKSKGLTAKEAVLYIAAGFVAQQVGEHIIDNYLKDKVTPVEGCLVYCKLGIIAEHSGIYIGGGKIVHLDGSGCIEVVSKEEFLGRLGGANPALSIYISCFDKNPVGSTRTAERALSMTNKNRDYNLILDNCHQFSSGCITGDFENADNFWFMVKNTAEKHYNANSWRVWD